MLRSVNATTTICRRLSMCCVAALTLATGAHSVAQTPQDKPPGLAPILVEADHFELNFASEQAIWRGNVTATQGNYTFRTSSLTLHMEQINSSSAQNSAVGAEDTHTNTSRYQLAAKNVSYDLEQGQIIGQGDCELRRGEESIRAEHIVYQVDNQMAFARPQANGRVQVQFYSNPQAPLFPTANLLSAVAGE